MKSRGKFYDTSGGDHLLLALDELVRLGFPKREADEFLLKAVEFRESKIAEVDNVIDVLENSFRNEAL